MMIVMQIGAYWAMVMLQMYRLVLNFIETCTDVLNLPEVI